MGLFNEKGHKQLERQEIIFKVKKGLNLSREQLSIPGPKGYKSKIDNEIAWCLKDLKDANKLMTCSWGVYELYKN